MKSWYNIKVNPINNATSTAEVSIYDEIGLWGVDAKTFKKDWDKIKNLKEIKVYVNSPGGSVFDGMAIYNMLSDSRDKVTVEVDGLAASIASIIAMAGKKLVMREGTLLMIHNAWSLAMGDSNEMRKTADTLDKINEQLISIYSGKTGMDAEEIKQLMNEETWLDADEAVEKGFADESVKAPRMAAKYSGEIMNSFKNAPTIEEVEDTLSRCKTITAVIDKDFTPIEEEIEDNSEEGRKALQAKILQLKINKLKNGNDSKSIR